MHFTKLAEDNKHFPPEDLVEYVSASALLSSCQAMCEYCVHFWSHNAKRHKQIEESPKEGHKELESLSCDERLKEVDLFSLKKVQ